MSFIIINEIIMPRGVYERKTVEERFWEYIEKCENGCWNWTGGCVRYGYGIIGIGDGKKMLSHRVSYEIHHPLTQPIQNIKMLVLHACDNPKCVNPQHLRLGTQFDNMNDKVERGRSSKGERNGKSKLTDQQVIEIREKYAQGNITYKKLGEEYGIGTSTTEEIINRKTWSHL